MTNPMVYTKTLRYLRLASIKENYKFTISPESCGIRVDKYVSSRIPELSRAKIKLLIENGNLKINNILCTSPKHCLKSEELLEFTAEINTTKAAKHISSGTQLEVIFEDEYIIIINKPAKLLVHSGAGRRDNITLIDLLLKHCDTLSGIAGEARPGVVHRLDMETSGLIVIAKDDITHSLLSKMFEKHTIKRKYLGFCYSTPVPQFGRITLKMKKAPQDKTRMIVSKNDDGKLSITNYRVVETYLDKKFSLLEFSLQTGRTHQIRLHMESKKTPIIGDKVYGKGLNFNLARFAELNKYLKSFPRHALHSYYIEFIHPRTDEELRFEIPMPSDMKALQEKLKGLEEPTQSQM